MNGFEHFGFAVAVTAAVAAAAQAAPPEHAVIWVIDGFSFHAPERVQMKNLQALMASGVYYRQNYTVMPADPSNVPGQWSRYHTSSIPNPVLLAGTVMLRPEGQHYVQESFFPLKITAHCVNEISYRALNVGFHLTFQAGGELMLGAGHKTGDDLTLYWATEFLRKTQPTFMLIHMQDTGFAGEASRSAPASSPWHNNIWADGSPYRQSLAQVDQYLGQFLDELQKLGLRDKTVIFITGDHGQTDMGWHPPEAQDAWSMPLVMAGPGMKAGQRFDYAEQVDIVPTLCHLMGVKTPDNADGRILAEALVDPPKSVPPRRQKLKELDNVLLECQNAIEKLRSQSAGSPAMKTKVAEADKDFYRIERILEWERFGTIDKLIDHHRQLLQRLNSKN